MWHPLSENQNRCYTVNGPYPYHVPDAEVLVIGRE